jgi:hypothetical protein
MEARRVMSERREINDLIDEYAVTTMMSRSELTAVAREYPDEDMVRFMFEAKANNPWVSWLWLAYVYREAPTLTLNES